MHIPLYILPQNRCKVKKKPGLNYKIVETGKSFIYNSVNKLYQILVVDELV